MIYLSIIIPVFNVEEYIGECIDSCLHQDIPGNEYEIILVDDSSSDKSIEVARKIYNSYPEEARPELRVISSGSATSRGAAAARNIGLPAAQGEYIWFVDSDDKIEKNCLSQLMEQVIRDKLDILRFGYKLLFDDNRTEEHINGATSVLQGKKLYAKFPHPVAVWSFIFRKSFLLDNSISFIEGYMFEDQDYSPRVHWYAERAKMASASFYYYRQRQGSVMKSNASRFKVESALAVCESLYSFGESHKDEVLYPVMSRQIAFMFSNALNINSQCKDAISLDRFGECHCYPLQGVSGVKYWLINFSLSISSLLCRIRHCWQS